MKRNDASASRIWSGAAQQLVRNIALTAQQLVALAPQIVDLERLTAALHADIAEVAEKAPGLERAQQLGGKRWLEPGGAAELGDRQKAVALDEVEPDEDVFGEGRARGRWPAPTALRG